MARTAILTATRTARNAPAASSSSALRPASASFSTQSKHNSFLSTLFGPKTPSPLPPITTAAPPPTRINTAPPPAAPSLDAVAPSPAASSASARTNTISAEEIAHFSSLAAHWWDPKGEFMFLHRMNPARVQFVRESLERVYEVEEEGAPGGGDWLAGKSVLDVGCGGGIFAESLARLGADTLAIDASAINIRTAQAHAALDPAFKLKNSPIQASSATRAGRRQHSLEYRHCAAEDLVRQGLQFDVVCAMEVIEHVEDPAGFLDCLAALTRPGGHLLLSTISRTPLAQLLTVTLAEDVLRYVTKGTHTYSKFIKPDELEQHFLSRGWRGMERRGCVYDPLKGGWRLLGMGEWWGAGEQANYFAGVRKPLE